MYWIFSELLFHRSWRDLPSPRESPPSPAAFPQLAGAVITFLGIEKCWKRRSSKLAFLFHNSVAQYKVASQFAWSPVLKHPILAVQLVVFEGKKGQEAGVPSLLSQVAFHCRSVPQPPYNLLTTLKMSQIALRSSDLWAKL